MSHEIRTPLATLEAHIDALEDGVILTTTATYEVMRGQVPNRLRRLASDVRPGGAGSGARARPAPDPHDGQRPRRIRMRAVRAALSGEGRAARQRARSRRDREMVVLVNRSRMGGTSATCWTTLCGTHRMGAPSASMPPERECGRDLVASRRGHRPRRRGPRVPAVPTWTPHADRIPAAAAWD